MISVANKSLYYIKFSEIIYFKKGKQFNLININWEKEIYQFNKINKIISWNIYYSQ